MSEDYRSIIKEAPTDTLALTLSELKQEITALRYKTYFIEDELRDRMLRNDATILLGERYRVKSSVKREITWDQDALTRAWDWAVQEGLTGLFGKAFPITRGFSVRGLNALLKLGGETAKAVEAAKSDVKEKLSIEVEELK